MNHNRLCSEILNRAADVVGGLEALARRLRQDPNDVKAWAEGRSLAPLDVYIEALDVLSAAPKRRN